MILNPVSNALRFFCICFFFLLLVCLDLVAKDECINTFLPLQGATFEMGCNSCMFEDERPQHTVSLANYEIMVFEVTNVEFLKWVNERSIKFPYLDELKKKAKFKSCFPVEKVNWYYAVQYCKYIGGRLPTEAEWEYAASIDIKEGKEKYRWNSGNFYLDPGKPSPNDNAAFETTDDSELKDLTDEQMERIIEEKIRRKKNKGRKGLASIPGPVQSSYLGLNSIYGMMGSLWEWVEDSYGPYQNASQVNPINLEQAAWKVIRGGSYQNITQKELMRTTVRNKAKPTSELLHIGFRCVRAIKNYK